MTESNDRVVAITGASGRLGRVVAARFAEAGYRLALLGRSKDDVADLAGSLPGGAGRHAAVGVDLASAESSSAAAAAVCQELGPASVLLQLVGGYAGGRAFADNDDEELGRLLDLNLWTTAHAIRAFLPDVAAAALGRIVTVSTFVAQTPTPRHAAYAASKAAVEALTISVARDLAGTTATANVIVLRSIGDEKATDQRPDEIAASMLWLCSPVAGAINGQRINLFGRA
ncbi:MAG TPA: SDR family NAD(P)-dependent oxidoreductase [Candidatus Limnocylindrales bacterium]|nr:SDR family NAD(P)-dependent oxidoreductase [Candidatus Limnocylindrales bacterium]